MTRHSDMVRLPFAGNTEILFALRTTDSEFTHVLGRFFGEYLTFVILGFVVDPAWLEAKHSSAFTLNKIRILCNRDFELYGFNLVVVFLRQYFFDLAFLDDRIALSASCLFELNRVLLSLLDLLTDGDYSFPGVFLEAGYVELMVALGSQQHVHLASLFFFSRNHTSAVATRVLFQMLGDFFLPVINIHHIYHLLEWLGHVLDFFHVVSIHGLVSPSHCGLRGNLLLLHLLLHNRCVLSLRLNWSSVLRNWLRSLLLHDGRGLGGKKSFEVVGEGDQQHVQVDK